MPSIKNWKLFYIAAVVCMVTIGASWGTYLLFQLSQKKQFTDLNLFEVNAHGQAQIYGWVAMMMIGSLYFILPKKFQNPLPLPRLSLFIWMLLLGGTLLSILGLFLISSPLFTAIGGGAQLIAAFLFSWQIGIFLFQAKDQNLARLYLMTALGFFLLATAYSFWHHLRLLEASDPKILLWQAATFQAPLRDLQVHGAALFMVFGVAQLLFTASSKWAKIAWALLLLAVVGETSLFLSYRITQNHFLAAGLMLPWAALFIGSFCLLIQGKLFVAAPFFAKTAFIWLLVSETMLLFLPLYSFFSRLAFSHAYYGAIRHAVTVGFLTQMIFGMSERFLSSSSSLLRVSLFFLNVGCFLRVFLQILTDFSQTGYSFLVWSGSCEVLASSLWGISLLKSLNRTKESEFISPKTSKIQ